MAKKRYTTIHPTIWREVSGLSPAAQAMRVYLQCNNSANMLGAYELPPGYAAVDLGWPAEHIDSAMAELADAGLIDWDPPTGAVFVRSALDHDPLRSPKTVSGALGILFRVGDSFPFVDSVVSALEDVVDMHRDSLTPRQLDAFDDMRHAAGMRRLRDAPEVGEIPTDGDGNPIGYRYGISKSKKAPGKGSRVGAHFANADMISIGYGYGIDTLKVAGGRWGQPPKENKKRARAREGADSVDNSGEKRQISPRPARKAGIRGTDAPPLRGDSPRANARDGPPPTAEPATIGHAHDRPPASPALRAESPPLRGDGRPPIPSPLVAVCATSRRPFARQAAEAAARSEPKPASPWARRKDS